MIDRTVTAGDHASPAAGPHRSGSRPAKSDALALALPPVVPLGYRASGLTTEAATAWDWAPVLGPSATLTIMYLHAEQPAELPIVEWGRRIGVNERVVRSALGRIIRFGLADGSGGSRLQIIVNVPPPSQRLLDLCRGRIGVPHTEGGPR